jgi:hypothetical protein
METTRREFVLVSRELAGTDARRVVTVRITGGITMTNTSTNTNPYAPTNDDENGPDVALVFTTVELRALGLPFRCDGGRIVEDQSISLAEDVRDPREYRFVTWELNGQGYGVQYSRPVDVPIGQLFEPWPDETEATATLYDEAEMGVFRQRFATTTPSKH